MKKTIFNATFEESNNLVTEEYVKKCFEESDNGVIGKRQLGVFVSSILLIGFALFISYIEKHSPHGNQTFASYFNFFWYGVGIVCPIIYTIDLTRFRQKRILNAYLFTRTTFVIMFFMSLLTFLFMLNIVRIIIGSNSLVVLYGLLGLGVIINRVLYVRQVMLQALYHQEKQNNPILDYYKKFEQFSKKYGFILLLGLFIFKQCSGGKKVMTSDWIEKFSALGAPFLGYAFFIFIFALVQEHLGGYYLNKYSEQYRIKYGYSQHQWSEGDN